MLAQRRPTAPIPDLSTGHCIGSGTPIRYLLSKYWTSHVHIAPYATLVPHIAQSDSTIRYASTEHRIAHLFVPGFAGVVESDAPESTAPGLRTVSYTHLTLPTICSV
eukprot:1864146-Rhodomonas_salina.1